MRTKVELAEDAGMKLLYENEKDIYGDMPSRCRDLYMAIDSPNFRAIFDLANYLEIGIHTYSDALLQVIEFVDYIHINEARSEVRDEMCPASEADGDINSIQSLNIFEAG